MSFWSLRHRGAKKEECFAANSSLKISPSGVFYPMGRHIESPPGFHILLILISKDTIHFGHDIIDYSCHNRIFSNRRFYNFVDEGFVLFTEWTNSKTG